MTADEAEKLIAVLKANGVRSFRDGEVSVEFAEPQRVRLPKPQRPELPEGAVPCDPMEAG